MKFIVDNQMSQMIISGLDGRKGDVEAYVREQMTVKVPGSYHIKKMLAERGQKFQWDGTKCFINKKGFFATGFLKEVLKLVHTFDPNIKVVFEDIRTNVPQFKKDWDFTTPDFELYEHQKEMVQSVCRHIRYKGEVLYFPRGIWKAATNSGKTAAFYNLIKNAEHPKALLLVDSQLLFHQHITYYQHVLGEENVGIIGAYIRPGYKSPKAIYDDKGMLVIAMVDTLYNKLKKSEAVRSSLFNDYNILGVDEVHGFSGNTASQVIQAVNAGMRVFMSGTPLDSSDHIAAAKLVGMSSNIICKVSKKYLMDNGFSMRANVKIYLHPTIHEPIKMRYAEQEEKIIMRSEERAELIADLIAQREGRQVLIPFWERLHGYLMYETFISKYPHLKSKTAFLYGEDKMSVRLEKIKAFNEKELQVLFGSTILQQGINIPTIQHIINGIGGKDIIGMSQFMGRGERLDGINKEFEWIDFLDGGHILQKHSLQRIKFYQAEELPITFMYDATKSGKPRKSKKAEQSSILGFD